MKKIPFLFIFIFCFIGFSQQKNEEIMYMVLENFTYKPNTSKLKFDLVIKNNSNKTLHFIKPENFFFRDHNDTEKEIKQYDLYYNKPYSITISPYKNCTNKRPAKESILKNIDVKEGVVVHEGVTNTKEIKDKGITKNTKDNNTVNKSSIIKESSLSSGSNTNTENIDANKLHQTRVYGIIDEIVEIPANEFRKFKNIEIKRKYGAFCKDVEYRININYYAYITIRTQMKTFENYLKRNDIKAINEVLNNQFSMLKKDPKLSNKENFERFVNIYNGMIETNDKNFSSNTIKGN